MTMIEDRELALIEPTLFIDAINQATLLIDATDGNVSNTTVTSLGSDFESMAIDFGHIVVIDGEVCEVINRISSAALTASLLRASQTDPLIEPTAGSGLSIKIVSFHRHIELAQAWVFGALGIDGGDPGLSLEESAILNPSMVAHLIALETIWRVLCAAAAIDPTDQSLADRAEHYGRLVSESRQQTKAILDLDGDGVADSTRRIGVVTLIRS